jgi:two-component system, response regulator YesN
MPNNRHPHTLLTKRVKLRANHQLNPAWKWPLAVIMVGGSQGLRMSLRAMVRHEPGFFIVAEAETGGAALADVFRCQPAVVLVDICLPDRNGFELVKDINHLVPTCATILLSNAPDPCVEDVARIVGAKAVWQTGSGVDQLRRTLRRLVHDVLARPCPI